MALATGVTAGSRFASARRIGFGVVLARYVLSLLHRVSPAALAGGKRAADAEGCENR